MKDGIHPTYYPDAQIICACGNTWTTGSTKKVIHTDVCNKCHPFYTGEQRIVDTEGQVDRFYKKLQARQQYLDDAQAREYARTSPERPIEELALGTRATDALAKANITNVGQAMELAGARRSCNPGGGWLWTQVLADLKKKLRQLGYELPEAAEEIVV